MKRFLFCIAMLLLSVTMVACGQSNDDDKNANKNKDEVINNDEQNDDQDKKVDTVTDEMTEKMKVLNYIDFELEVTYANDQEYEAKIEKDDDHNGVEAKLEDDLQGVKIKGEEAFNEIFPLVEKVEIDQNTSKEDAIKQTLDAFGLDADYTKFELEIKFQDGTKIEFEEIK